MIQLYSSPDELVSPSNGRVVGDSDEIIICPACLASIVIPDQRKGGRLAKKKNHQLFLSDLVWKKFAASKGTMTMEEYIKRLCTSHERQQEYYNFMASVEPKPPMPKKQGSDNIRVHVVGNTEKQQIKAGAKKQNV